MVPVVDRLWFLFLSLWHRPKSNLWKRNKKNVAYMVRARSIIIMATHIILQVTHSTLLDTAPTHNNQDTTPTHRPVRKNSTILVKWIHLIIDCEKIVEIECRENSISLEIIQTDFERELVWTSSYFVISTNPNSGMNVDVNSIQLQLIRDEL